MLGQQVLAKLYGKDGKLTMDGCVCGSHPHSGQLLDSHTDQFSGGRLYWVSENLPLLNTYVRSLTLSLGPKLLRPIAPSGTEDPIIADEVWNHLSLPASPLRSMNGSTVLYQNTDKYLVLVPCRNLVWFKK